MSKNKMKLRNQLLQEYKQDGRLDKLTKGNTVALEQAFFKDEAKECEKCKRVNDLTLDHIVPKDIMFQLGIDIDRVFIEDNLRILCKLCNQFKSNKLDFSTPKTKEILLRYLEKI
jgi:5-methylcytosine-specific restriction endonuclease McrA